MIDRRNFMGAALLGVGIPYSTMLPGQREPSFPAEPTPEKKYLQTWGAALSLVGSHMKTFQLNYDEMPTYQNGGLKGHTAGIGPLSVWSKRLKDWDSWYLSSYVDQVWGDDHFLHQYITGNQHRYRHSSEIPKRLFSGDPNQVVDITRLMFNEYGCGRYNFKITDEQMNLWMGMFEKGFQYDD